MGLQSTQNLRGEQHQHAQLAAAPFSMDSGTSASLRGDELAGGMASLGRIREFVVVNSTHLIGLRRRTAST